MSDPNREPPDPAALAALDRLRAILNDPIVWTRDLEDDCVAVWHGWGGHAERMDVNDWFASVYRIGQTDDDDSEDALHSTSQDLSASSGPAARRLCELVMRLEAARAALEGRS